MMPTLLPGTLFLLDRAYYRTEPVRAGEIVVVHFNGDTLIKRVYAVGGDRFWAFREVIGDELVHNPVPQEQLDLDRRLVARQNQLGRYDSRLVRLRVPNSCVFLMGDNDESLDSRSFGYVDSANIVGRVFGVQEQGNLSRSTREIPADGTSSG